MSSAEQAQEQLLKYARDLARAHVSERDKAKQLEDTLQKLEDAYRELERANAELAKQRDALSERVVRREHELKEARTQLGNLGADGATVFHGMVSGESEMLRVFDTIRLVSDTDVSVLIHGESGTGKELVARAIHAESPRSGKPFVAVNCAAVTPSLAESLLFGHVKGAFTGALANHSGVFREAQGGTLFLDEVAELPLEIQSKLLRVVQEKVVTPVGASGSVNIDVRIVAASHRSLPEEVREGRFREDLMYRLRVVPIDLPPLRRRKTDLPRLLRHLIARLNGAAGDRHIESVAPSALRQLLDHDWPGNVRELENVLQYAFAIAAGGQLTLEHLPPDLSLRARPREEPVAAPVRAVIPADEKAAITSALAQCDGRVHDAARALGMSRATFHRKRKKHGLV